ncbi:MAG: UDP-N-acetylglucosamine 2-epimerase [Candidatus Omnitrophica bacterium]|nr:UDP-N-acetylglucosamine 2-epimerase [Candidatus Omnitrophota bacterium]
MIHILVGTKAQFIKMAPLMQRLQTKGLIFNLIDLGQHSLITKSLREEFGIKEPDISLSEGKNITNLSQASIWLIKIMTKSLSSKWVRKNIFQGEKGVCLIHGDTLSTLLGLYLAKTAGLKVAHIEAGLRSFCWLEPFPEEIIRVIAMRFSDFLFAPSEWAFRNLIHTGLGKKAILLCGNTGQEAVFLSLLKKVDLNLEIKDYVLVTFHRIENIFSRGRLIFILNIIKTISERFPLIFVQHPPTLHQLKKFGFDLYLKNLKNIFYLQILSHSHFIYLLKNSLFVITDGGSIQEEAYYLGKPCLLLRRYTERNEGLNENVILSNFNYKIAQDFIDNFKNFIHKDKLTASTEVSDSILDFLRDYV